jgi:hypothetical protein
VTLVLGGATAEPAAWDEERVRQALVEALGSGADRKEAIRRVAQASGWPRREVYRLAVQDAGCRKEDAGCKRQEACTEERKSD